MPSRPGLHVGCKLPFHAIGCPDWIPEGQLWPMQPGQVPPDHPDAGKPVAWGEHPRDCDCGDCP
jgi:hypothetical protein